MTTQTFYRIAGTVAALATVTSVISAILCLMKPPIFGIVGLSWVFFCGLVAAGIGTSAMMVRSIWDEHR
jgi:hypothetical protein